MKGLIKAIIEEIRTDFEFLGKIGKRIRKGEPVIREEYKAQWKKDLKNFTWTEFVREASPLFTFLVVGVLIGFVASANHYTEKASEAVNDLILEPLERGEIICRSATTFGNDLIYSNGTFLEVEADVRETDR